MGHVVIDPLADFYVYVLSRPDGSPCYVGKGRRDRWLQHERTKNHVNKRLGRIISKAGGTLLKIKVREGLTNEEASETEIALIAALGRAPNGPLVNLTDGGDGKNGYATSIETAEKIRQSNIGKVQSVETRLKRQRSLAGKPKTAAHNAAVSSALKGKPKSETARASMRRASAERWRRKSERDKLRNYFEGLSDEQRQWRNRRISEATIVAMASPEVRAKISAARSVR